MSNDNVIQFTLPEHLQPVAPTATTCSFCGRPKNKVKNLLTSPGTPGICSECVEQCNVLIRGVASEDCP